jgi:hypothetical protein
MSDLDYDLGAMIESWHDTWEGVLPRAVVSAQRAHARRAGDHGGHDGVDYGAYDDAPGLAEELSRARDHSALFYESESQRLDAVVRFTSEGLAAGDRVLLVLSPSAERAVRAALPPALMTAAENAGRFSIADAHTTLDRLVHADELDLEYFDSELAGAVREHRAQGRVRIYGELVTMLWSRGHVVTALQLERLWNDLQQELDFRVLCAYPLSLVPAGSSDGEAVRACHTDARVLETP